MALKWARDEHGAMLASRLVANAEALDGLPKIAALLAEGAIDWRSVQLIITRTELVMTVDRAVMSAGQRIAVAELVRRPDQHRRPAGRTMDPGADKERRRTADADR